MDSFRIGAIITDSARMCSSWRIFSAQPKGCGYAATMLVARGPGL